MPFRIASKQLFLTYSQANNIFKERLLEFFLSKGCLESYVIGEEIHEDGGEHYHCYLKYKRKIETTNERYFDYMGNHPNFQRMGSRKEDAVSVAAYCMKEDPMPLVLNPPVRNTWKDALAAKTRKEFLDKVKEISPRDYILQFSKVNDFADRFYCPPKPVFEPPENPFIEPSALEQWRMENCSLPRPDARPVSLVLIGDSRLGKTQWARSLFPDNHTYCAGSYSLEAITNNASVYIWDDIPWERVPCRKQFFGGQKEPFFLSDKYKGKREVYLGGPSIYLCNSYPAFTEERNWIDRNVTIISINEPLF